MFHACKAGGNGVSFPWKYKTTFLVSFLIKERDPGFTKLQFQIHVTKKYRGQPGKQLILTRV